jgi:hypothetical protein
MEGFLNTYINIFFQYQKKYVILKDFILSINDYNEKENKHTKEHEYHIKYISIIEQTSNFFKLHVKNLNAGTTLFFKTESEEDCLNWINAIKLNSTKYEKFIDEYYINNNCEHLILNNSSNNFDCLENFTSFKDFLNEISHILLSAETNIIELNINTNLENILNFQNNFVKKFDNYILEIEKYYFKLNPTNNEEFQIMNRSKEIKTLFEELKQIISDCTYGLNSEEITVYISSFREKYINKIKETKSLLEEIEYAIKYYISFYQGSSEETQKDFESFNLNEGIHSNSNSISIDTNKNTINTNNTNNSTSTYINENYISHNFHEEEANKKFQNLLLKNEMLKFKICDLNKESDIINLFINEN